MFIILINETDLVNMLFNTEIFSFFVTDLQIIFFLKDLLIINLMFNP